MKPFSAVLRIIAFGIGLALPFTILIIKISLFAVVILLDIWHNRKISHKKHDLITYWITGIVTGYLYKFIQI
ncbi:hypothetical protein BC351_20225 [Paenibacillus ferrarius]|uniref:Uncharacterized protein n=1 Tax=Paenibacillus ferrarius TaxID=1469647 RepID=A0A1V4HN60_9BACL|nr:hypothetical protein BC351_20225 [Paenibacillus ferrarius]